MPKYMRSIKDRLAFQRILFGSLNVTRTRLSLCQWVRVHIALQNGFNNEVFINLEVQRSLSKMATWPGLSVPKTSRNWAFTLIMLIPSLWVIPRRSTTSFWLLMGLILCGARLALLAQRPRISFRSFSP